LFEKGEETSSMSEVSMNPHPSEKSASTEAQAPKSRNWVYTVFFTLFFSCTIMVGGLSSVTIKQLLLPVQISQLAPHDTNTAFTLVASVGAFMGLLASLTMAALSDRPILRWGRRRPWIICGIIVAAMGMIIMAVSTEVATVLLGDILAQAGVDTLLATTTAIIPDQVPKRQRYFISACTGMAPNVGGVVGLVLVTTLTNTRVVFQGYVLMAAISACSVMLFLLLFREQEVAREDVSPFHLGSFLASFLHPLRSRDFCYTLASRGCIYLAFTMVSAYLLFSLRAVFHLAVPVASIELTSFQVLSTAILLVVAICAGLFSQRVNRLKPFVIIGALLMAVGLVVIAFAPGLSLLRVAAVLFGGGFGLYLGVDINVVVRVLPSDSSRGKDLSIMYAAIFVPVIVSTLIGGPVLNLSHNNFALVFVVAACSSVVSGVLIVPIKSVR
jgi:MFS family permease